MSSQLQLQKKKRVQYKPEQMAMAINAVKSGMAKKAAAKLYQVPKTTLLDKLAGRVPEETTKPGTKPTLTKAEETTLVNYGKMMCEIGYPLTSKEFRTEVKRILDIDGRQTPFKENMPGRQWMSSFIRRHPEMAFRTPAGLGHERACITTDMVTNWYSGLFKFLQAEIDDYETLIHDPRRIFNADESGFPLAVKAGRVLAPTGAKHVYQVVPSSKTQITVMACLNAFGNYVPPMILFPGERIRNIGLEGFQDALYAVTKNGWMDSDAFVDFLKHLVAYAKSKEIRFPIILFVDGHSTHMSLPAAEYCCENKVVLYCLLPNATHILQACDVGLFSPMKSAWHRTVKEWQMAHIGETLTKKQFPTLFKSVWDQVATMENACSGFRRAGLFPLTSAGIDKSKLSPSRIIKAATAVLPSGDQYCDTVSCTPETLMSSDVAAYEEVASANSAGHCSGEEPQASGDASFEVSTNEQTDYPSCDSRTSETELESGQETPKQQRRDHDYVSPAFLQLSVPEPKEKKKAAKLREKLPKALSGSEALKMLRDKQAKKEAEQKAKEERKREREQNRLKKQQEAEKKKKERELKKKERELNKVLKAQTKKSRKRSLPSSDSESGDDIPYMDCESDDFVEEFDVCPKCLLASGEPSEWITCESCLVPWHIRCADRLEFLLLDDEGKKDVEFICPDCL